VFNVVKLIVTLEDPIPGQKSIVVPAPIIVDGEEE